VWRVLEVELLGAAIENGGPSDFGHFEPRPRPGSHWTRPQCLTAHLGHCSTLLHGLNGALHASLERIVRHLKESGSRSRAASEPASTSQWPEQFRTEFTQLARCAAPCRPVAVAALQRVGLANFD
jgi:hypothetical protein